MNAGAEIRMSLLRSERRYPYHTGGMIYYEGSRRQRGGNLFSTLKRMVMPSAKNVLKKVGKEAMKRGVELGAGALKDKLLNKDVNLQDAFRNRAAQALEKVESDVVGILKSQDGAGLRRKRRRTRTVSTGRKRRRVAGRRRAPVRRKRRRKPLKRLKRKSINKMRKRRRRTKGRKVIDILGN